MTAFTRKVYQAVLEIPLGQVRSYKWVARRAGRPGAWRAVGQILKKNPFLLIIPCHRVVNSNGKLGGYQQGRPAKRKILDLEQRIRGLILTTKNTKR